MLNDLLNADHHPLRRRRAPRALVLVAGAALALAGCAGNGGSAAPNDAQSEPSAIEATEADRTACIEAGEVWLLVAAEDGTVLADTCVGTPETGTAALEAAGLTLERDGNGMLCAIGGEPARCPATFDGRFWQYFTAQAGGEWEFATAGSDDAVPQAGSFEGWCYGETCTPPVVDGIGASAAPLG